MHDALGARVDAFLKQAARLAPGDTLIVGVSGGPDSLCLLHLLAARRALHGYALHVAHFDHMLRGAESAADAAFVAQQAQALGLPVTIERADVGAAAQHARANLHHTARVLRYRFFARLAEASAARTVAVAHTADDQAETVLMHLLRGAGTDGLAGMQPMSDLQRAIDYWDRAAEDRRQAHIVHRTLIRPLLTSTRAEIEAYCAAHGLRPRYDATNDDQRYTRNHLRHTLLPQMRAAAPQVVAALGRTAAICADDADFIAQALDAVWPTLARTGARAVTLDGAAWRALHPALQRAALRRAYALLASGTTLTWERVEAARALFGQVGKQIELPGVRLMITYAGATLTMRDQPAPALSGPQLAVETCALPLPGRLALEHGWALHTATGAALTPPGRWAALLDADALPGPLLVRRRRAGDRLRPVGGAGSRRVQDMFVDAKIPRELRAAWPLVATHATVVWVPGVRAAAEFAAASDSAHIISIWISPPDVGHDEQLRKQAHGP